MQLHGAQEQIESNQAASDTLNSMLQSGFIKKDASGVMVPGDAHNNM
jgi:hypothetical protein